MIFTLTGLLFQKLPEMLIVDVGGVGYGLAISGRTYEKLPAAGEEVLLYVHTAVKDDGITLYGFAEEEEKQMFLLLNSVSGIGPKLALAILSGMDVRALSEAIRNKDLQRLTSLSGVGKKTAQRLCMELGEKVARFIPQVSDEEVKVIRASVSDDQVLQDVASALINLGYPQNLAWQALRTIQQQDPEAVASMEIEELIRRALQALA